LRKLLETEWNIKPERIVAILEANPKTLSLDIKDRILHTIISGPLDVDKLDYLVRDSDNCQTVFANGLDRSRLLSTLTIVYQRTVPGDDQYFALGIHEKGRAVAESLGFIRFQMFRAIYWHHTVRSAKAMLQRAAHEWIISQKHSLNLNDKLKHEFQDFVLQKSDVDKTRAIGQSNLFELSREGFSGQIGHTMKPEWSNLNHTDIIALEWFYIRTSDVGKQLIDAIAKRKLYKRVLVISSYQEPDLWKQIQDDLKSYSRIRERSEELRKALKTRIDEMLKKDSEYTKRFYVTGLGDDTDHVLAASKILGMEGTVLIDMPNPRGKENLYFFSEDVHRGQREEFQADSLLSVSELWKLLSDNLHETAGNIRIFIHPETYVLSSAKTKENNRLMDSKIIQEELKKIFGN